MAAGRPIGVGAKLKAGPSLDLVSCDVIVFRYVCVGRRVGGGGGLKKTQKVYILI